MFAYLDAQSGSVIASAMAAGFAGVAVVFRMWGRRAGKFFSRNSDESLEPAAEGATLEAANTTDPRGSDD